VTVVHVQSNSTSSSYITVSESDDPMMDPEDYKTGWRFYRYIYTKFRGGMPAPGGATGTVKHLPSNGTVALLKEVFEDLETKGVK